jgi:hypothetical protein
MKYFETILHTIWSLVGLNYRSIYVSYNILMKLYGDTEAIRSVKLWASFRPSWQQHDCSSNTCTNHSSHYTVTVPAMNHEGNWINGSITIYRMEYIFFQICSLHTFSLCRSYCGLFYYDTLLLSGWCVQVFWINIPASFLGLKLT